MESFKGYGLAQFAIGNEAKFRAMVALAMDTVATVQGWTEGEKVKSRAECEAGLAMALTLAKVPETSARRVVATVKGLVTQFGKDYRDTLASVKSAMLADGSNMDSAAAVAVMVSSLQAEGVENLGFLEAYSRKGKPGLAAVKAEAEAKIAAAEARASMTEAEATEAAAAEAEAATEAAADQSPRAKAAKQAAAILASLAKHGQMMDTAELAAIAAAIAEVMQARLSVAADKRAADLAADASAKRAA